MGEAGLIDAADVRVGLDECLALARRNWIGLTLWVAVCFGAGAVYLYRAVPQFVASAQVVLEARRPQPGSAESLSVLGLALDGSQADSQIEVVKSERSLRLVFDAMKGAPMPKSEGASGILGRLTGLLVGPGPQVSDADEDRLRRAAAFQDFQDRLGVSRLGQSYVLTVSYTATDPEVAARVANAVVASYLLGQVQYRAAFVQRGAEFLQNRVSDVAAEITALSEAAKTGTITDAVFPDAEARLISTASPPLAKSFPRSKLVIALTGIFALLTSAGYVIVRHALDRTVRTRRQISRAVDAQCLSVLPRIRQKGMRRADRSAVPLDFVLRFPQSPFAGRSRVLRASLFSAGLLRPSSLAVGVVSCWPGEGRSTVAANLAHLLAASAEPTVLIDADLNGPSLTRALARGVHEGLSEVLASHTTPLQLPEVRIADDLVLVPAVGAGQEADPNTFIGSNDMRELMVGIRVGRNVVVDLPPLHVSSDAQAIGHMLDGVILIVEVDRTLIGDVVEAVRSLKAADVRLLGLVLNKAHSSG